MRLFAENSNSKSFRRQRAVSIFIRITNVLRLRDNVNILAGEPQFWLEIIRTSKNKSFKGLLDIVCPRKHRGPNGGRSILQM